MLNQPTKRKRVRIIATGDNINLDFTVTERQAVADLRRIRNFNIVAAAAKGGTRMFRGKIIAVKPGNVLKVKTCVV